MTGRPARASLDPDRRPTGTGNGQAVEQLDADAGYAAILVRCLRCGATVAADLADRRRHDRHHEALRALWQANGTGSGPPAG